MFINWRYVHWEKQRYTSKCQFRFSTKHLLEAIAPSPSGIRSRIHSPENFCPAPAKSWQFSSVLPFLRSVYLQIACCIFFWFQKVLKKTRTLSKRTHKQLVLSHHMFDIYLSLALITVTFLIFYFNLIQLQSFILWKSNLYSLPQEARGRWLLQA